MGHRICLSFGVHKAGSSPFSGAEGIEKARIFHPEVVFCDIGLPGMDGYEVARAIGADPALRSVSRVALTGYAGTEDIARSVAAGFDLHVAKPPTVENLEQILASLPPRTFQPSAV